MKTVLSVIAAVLVLSASCVVYYFVVPPVWSVQQSPIGNYKYEYRYKNCTVDVREDGTGVIVAAYDLDDDGGISYYSRIVQKVEDGKLFVSHTVFEIDDGRIFFSGYDVFETHCREAARKGLPDSVKAAFQGHYGLGLAK